MRKPTALIVDDERSICESLSGVLSDEGWESVTAGSGRQALLEFKRQEFDLVFLDVWMPNMDGIETLQKLKEMGRVTPIVIMSGHGTIETAVRATRLGAFDYLEKPLSIDKILPILGHASRMTPDGAHQDKMNTSYPLVGDSEQMRQITKQISMVAPRNSWVLITGENGTGKEVVARNIHALSSRADKAFVAVNCAAIPEELIESELFGHVKGAFTGAVANKRGKFELADQGTLFLDEIGDMGLRTQAKILRILQERQFERVGEHETVSVDVRVIAATNKDLAEEISLGNFREDLYYRLNVIPFHLPPLRERSKDVLALTNFFLDQIAADLREPRKTLSAETLQVFLSYSWPGNIRQLRNVIERLYILTSGPQVGVEDLPSSLFENSASDPSRTAALGAATLKEAKNDFERAYILGKLQEFQWNVSKTAEAIGIERSNLHRKLRAYDIDPKRLKG